jgi:hypothetical protein
MKNQLKTAPLGANLRDRHPELFGLYRERVIMDRKRNGRRHYKRDHRRLDIDRATPSWKQYQRRLVRHGEKP